MGVHIDMTDNFELLLEDEAENYYNHNTYYIDDGDKFLLRFLKERGLMGRFHRLFNDIESGLGYRRFIYGYVFSYSKIPGEETIHCFCATFRMKDYFLNAFVWDDKEFWRNVHNEWLEHLKVQFPHLQ